MSACIKGDGLCCPKLHACRIPPIILQLKAGAKRTIVQYLVPGIGAVIINGILDHGGYISCAQCKTNMIIIHSITQVFMVFPPLVSFIDHHAISTFHPDIHPIGHFLGCLLQFLSIHPESNLVILPGEIILALRNIAAIGFYRNCSRLSLLQLKEQFAICWHINLNQEINNCIATFFLQLP